MHSGILTDFYELTMAQGYYKTDHANKIATFELFYRKNPFEGGYMVAAGIADAVDFVRNFHFTSSDIEYLREQNVFDDDFLQYLSKLKFEGTIEGVPEGTIVFPYEPIIQITAPLITAQLLESALLNIVNFQTLIASKAARICYASKRKDTVLEFGLRRAHGDSSIAGAKAAIIGGCIGTSNVAAGKKYGVKISGTHAHSWIQSFDNELEAFRKYAEIYPDSSTLLVDTYDVLNSGLPNAITVAKELRQKGHELKAIRIDSGDLAWLAKKSSEILDKEGFPDVKIILSSDLDEYLIESIIQQIDDKKIIDKLIWGVGTKLITGSTNFTSALGGVYKLVEIDGHPVIKISENRLKITNPGRKKLWRIHDNGKWVADVISLYSEDAPEPGDVIYHPTDPSKFYKLCNCIREPLHVNLMELYKDNSNNWKEARDYVRKQLNELDPSHLRFLNPHEYKVSLSEKLSDMKQKFILENKK